MNCSFNVLWFEDEADWYDQKLREFQELLEPHCLNLKPTRKRGGDYEDSLFTDNSYDLILMDYKLITTETGEKVIEKIRSCNVLTDVLFYSSQYSDMLNSISHTSPPIDGIYYADRKATEFQPKLKALVDKLIKRSEDTINLRGFVLDNACSFEVRIKSILEMCWQKFPPEKREMLEEAARNRMTKIRDERISEYNTILENPVAFTDAMNSHHLFTNTDRLKLLGTILAILSSEYGYTMSEKQKKFQHFYETEVGVYRNALGHRKDSDIYIVVSKTNVAIDADLHRKLRRTIHEYDREIGLIESHITNHV